MCPFIETLRAEKGSYSLLEFHQARLNRTLKETTGLNCFPELKEALPPAPEHGIWKCRVVYHEKILSVSITPYARRNITRLILKEASHLCYPFKSSNRQELEILRKGLTDFEEVLITRQGKLTDSVFSNLAFHDGKNWHTPDTPLLCGVRREFLISQGILKPRPIKIQDLQQFQKVCLINAMLDLEELCLPVSAIQILKS